MKTLKKVVLSVVLATSCISGFAQQSPIFTHYMDNTLVVNPGYAGSRDALTVTALARSQWSDFKGAPTTQTITMHAPMSNQNIGLGLSIMNDNIGPTNNVSIKADFAYIMQVTAASKLALGLSAGADIHQANLSSLQLDQQADPLFQNNINNQVKPNFGAGAYYYRERFYAGVSSPDLVQNTYSDGSGKQQRHYYFIGGALFNLANNLAFKPTTLIEVTADAPAQMDITASFIIVKKFLLGAMFRTGDAVGALVGLDITPQLHIGYSYDFSYGLETSKYNQGSHEIMLRYDFIFFDKRQIHSPRYF